ncbi:hypothetical protein [Sphingomonas sp.]|uniref:hypothetical protein n=1 Tax=Sphingomonas sp. TaxID=28214 RepID=UPI002FC65C5C
MEDLAGPGAPKLEPSEPNVHLWSRDGFLGVNAVALQPGYTPDYISVEGPHAPRRIELATLKTADQDDPDALPTLILTSRQGVKFSLSRRRAAMGFALKNVECDELHFIQSGGARFDSEFGNLDAGQADFVCIPKGSAYRVTPDGGDLIDLIVESPGALKFDTPAPFGMINFAQDVRRPRIESPSGAPGEPGGEGRHILLLKAEDGITRFVKPVDPLAAIVQVGGEAPLWALNLAAIQQVSYGGLGGPPAHFLASPDNIMLVFDLSARAAKMRPPIHHNADYDEIILYVGGPGAYGACTTPGTLTIVPKGVTHHGPSEDVPEGYAAFLIETRATLRFTDAALPSSKLMETGRYGVHPSEAG